jgi:simple sugar transport system ATP-binding protein/ribose transport system ATP-binding protein
MTGPAEQIASAVHLRVVDVRKAFGGTQALDGVSLEIRAGSVHALVGENGAGKSTLAKIIAGVFPPDEGHLELRDAPVSFHSPRDALDHGIAIVAQELALVPQLTVAQNVFLGVEPRASGFLRERELVQRFERLTKESHFDLPASTQAGRLPLAKQQQVEILRALARNAELIVLDEPSAALSGREVEQLHEIVRGLARAGRTVVLVSHFLREVLDLADTITILRDGRLVRSGPSAAETEVSLFSGMLGRSFSRTFPDKHAASPESAIALDVQDLHGPGVNGVSLTVRGGEIVALAGLVGAGRTELARAIYGASSASAGTVRVDGAAVAGGPAKSVRRGMALIPESRKDEGLVARRPVRENVSLATLPVLQRLGFVRRRTEDMRVRTALTDVAARTDPAVPVITLSGGNQQKVVFARALLLKPRVLIADEPTRGVDVGAKRSIYELIAQLARDGVGVLLISSEIEEILGLAHRVLVMRGGRVVAELEGQAISEANILAAAFAAPVTEGAAA